MFGRFGKKPPSVERVVAEVKRHAKAGDFERAWTAAAPLLDAATDANSAVALAALVQEGSLPRDRGLEVLERLFGPHRENAEVVLSIAQAYDGVHELRFLNAPPPDAPFLAEVAKRLEALCAERDETSAWSALGHFARLLGRKWDVVAERALRRCCELQPKNGTCAYNLGLFFKTRGRFDEGVEANQRATELGAQNDESVLWNLAICATGARRGDVALDAQRKLGLKLEPNGRWGLPEGKFGYVKVRVAERPLAQRDAEHDDPGNEENIWIDRLSACHGVIRSVLLEKSGVDYGDVVLFDGAPITEHEVHGQMVPMFPHLATLVHSGYQFFDFGGTQQKPDQLVDLSKQLPDDAVLYSHTEQVNILCQQCSDGSGAHDHKDAEHHVVFGQLAAPPSVSARDLLGAVDAAVKSEEGIRLYVPELCRAASEVERAEVEGNRMLMLKGESKGR